MSIDRIIAVVSLVVGVASFYIGLRALGTAEKVRREVNQRIMRDDFFKNIDGILSRLGTLYETLSDSRQPLSREDYYAVREEMSVLLASYGDNLSPEAKGAIAEEYETVATDAEKSILLDDDPRWENKMHFRKKHAERLAVIITLLKKERKQLYL